MTSDRTSDPLCRFTDRVGDYERSRPTYPTAVLDVLRAEIGFDERWVVADIGSGTGIATELLLDHGNTVFAVEPNEAMRAAAERRLGARPGFASVRGSAERTGLPPKSVDAVVAAQAFHWFEPAAARQELGRVLRDPPWVVLLWNTRHTDTTPFMGEYEALLLQHGMDYDGARREGTARALEVFFGDAVLRRAVPNEQLLDFEGLQGLLLSTSYTPPPGHPARSPMLADLRSIFDRHERNGVVRMTYDCEIFVGCLRAVT